MPAEIIPFPNQKKPKVAKSIDLYYCWDQRLNNPYLNSLYKEQVCYVERWYLQAQHLLNHEDFSHPIIQTLLNRDDGTLIILDDCTKKDLAVQHFYYDKTTSEAAKVQIVRLNKWQARWQSLIEYRLRQQNS